MQHSSTYLQYSIEGGGARTGRAMASLISSWLHHDDIIAISKEEIQVSF